MNKKDVALELEDNDSEFAMVFSDLMSFVAGLFILLFTIVNTQQSSPQYFAEMSIKFGGKTVEQDQKVTTEDMLISDVQQYIQKERLSQYALVLVDEQRIRLILNDPILFESATHDLLPESKSILNGLINLIQSVENPMIIEGHTDDLNVKPGGRYRSNWDLGYYRASSVADYMISNGVSPNRLTISSQGEYRPLSPQKTRLARKKNRRIELHIIRIKKAA